jgi:predicted ATPase
MRSTLALLSEGTLVSILGPPGVGKTSLAVEVARHVDARAAFFLDVSMARTEEALCLEISSRLGQPETRAAAVGAQLAALGPLLLVLDNVEQLVGSLGSLEQWLGAAPQVIWLVTSRERLALGHERVVELGPLPLPRDAELEAPAMRLFFERARAVGGRGEDAPDAVAEIVRLVDGLPLAIELAAARTRLLGPRELATRLREGGAEVLREAARTPARHRSLTDAIGWSWRLLDPLEQDVLALLSTFSGPFDAGLAEALLRHAAIEIDAEGRDPLGLLAALREKSLLHVVSEPHVGMYESVRRFARAELERDPSKAARAWAAHTRVLSDAASSFVRARLLLAPTSAGASQGDFLQLRADASAALDRALDPRARVELVMALALSGRWLPPGELQRAAALEFPALTRALLHLVALRVHASEGRMDRARALGRALFEDTSLPASLRAAACLQLGFAERQVGRTHAATRAHRDAVMLLDAVRPGDPAVSDGAARLSAVNTACLGRLAGDLRAFDEARTLNERARVECERLGEPWLAALGPANLAQIAIEEGAFERAEALLIEAVERFRQAREPLYRTIYAAITGGLYLEWERLEVAREWYATLDARDTAALPSVLGVQVEGMRAVLDARSGDARAAAERLERARRRRDESPNPLSDRLHELAALTVAVILGRATAAETERAHAWAEARTSEGENDHDHLDARALGRLLTRALTNRAPRLTLEGDGFAVDGGPPVSLKTRGALRRILAALADAHATGVLLDASAIFAHGWPGQSIRPDSASMRVRSAIATLRKLGLRELLVTHDAGYRLAPEAQVTRGSQER